MQRDISRSARSSGRSIVARARSAQLILTTTVLVLLPQIVSAQGSPWERAASNLERTFTGPLAREMGAKRQLAGIVFGGGLALFAAQFLVWLF